MPGSLLESTGGSIFPSAEATTLQTGDLHPNSPLKSLQDACFQQTTLQFCPVLDSSEFIRLVSVCQPDYFLWENVPGVLSNDSGRTFRQFTNKILECGYSCAWRVLDSQYFGVAQSRRRVYLVGHHDWRCAASVLFEPEVLCGHFIQSKATIEANTIPCFVDVYNHRVSGNIAATFGANSGGTNTAGPKIIDRDGRIRRVTPIEAERLMGFPDDYTLIPGKCLESWRYNTAVQDGTEL